MINLGHAASAFLSRRHRENGTGKQNILKEIITLIMQLVEIRH